MFTRWKIFLNDGHRAMIKDESDKLIATMGAETGMQEARIVAAAPYLLEVLVEVDKAIALVQADDQSGFLRRMIKKGIDSTNDRNENNR